MRNRLFIATLFAFVFGCGGASPEPAHAPASEPAAQASSTGSSDGSDVQTGSVAAALAGSHRSDEDRARDPYRHPEETLAFFGLQPNMNVIEMQPGRGWYTSVLALVLRDQGHLSVAQGDPAEDHYAQAEVELMHAHPEVFDQVESVVFHPPEQVDLGEPGSADMVLTFRSVHNWVRHGYEQEVFNAMARVLKPGGVLGVVQHRAPEGATPLESAEQGYVPEAYIVHLAEEAGLRLDARSDVNANPADDHEHPHGVWSLPPTLRGEDEDRDAFVEVGESDRMTLRFVKPDGAESAAGSDAESETAAQ